ncbi:hypothetical protein FHG87_004602 [Trinorchestia longiramus]|nr:hypothetical protein FHG87_004602 [Trinorchestia longiramus]
MLLKPGCAVEQYKALAKVVGAEGIVISSDPHHTMQFSVSLMLAVTAAATAAPAFPKKYDPAIHGPKRTTSNKEFKDKLQDPLKALKSNSYDGFEGALEVPLQPPAEYPYLRSDGQAHGDMSPPPASTDDDDDTTSSYLMYDNDGEMVAMTPPPISTYAIIPASNDSADTMSFLRFLVRALPKDSSYSKYDADPEPTELGLPEQRPESSYLAYGGAAKADDIEVPSKKPKKENTESSYSTYH